MAGQGKRRRIAEGIHEDQYGRDVRVKVNGVQRTKRFSFETDLAVMKAWQTRTRADLQEQALKGTTEVVAPSTGTVAEAAVRFVKQIGGRASAKADASHMQAWVNLYGTWPLAKIDEQLVNEAYAQWEAKGSWGKRPASKQTLRHRARVLMELWRMEFGKDAQCPVKDARRIPKPKPQPVYVPDEKLREVNQNFLNLPQTPTVKIDYAYFRLLVTTGQRPCQIDRALPHHVILTGDKPRWYVVEAKGESSHTVFLNDEMIAAWRLFIEADAWGKGNEGRRTDLMRKCGWPKDVRPYNLRHSFAFSMMDRGGDISDVQAALGHHDPTTTLRSYYKHQEKRQRRMSELMNGRLTEPTTQPKNKKRTAA